jgi:Tol biopolymer transport system component
MAARDASPRTAAFTFALATAVVAVLAAFAAAWYLKPTAVSAPQAVARFTLPMPPDVTMPLGAQGRVAASPDGTYVAFVGRRAGHEQLYLRALQNGDAHAIPDTEGVDQPFFSPDGRWLAFFHKGKLKKVPTSGGVPIVIADATSSRSGFWGDNGTIVFAPQARGRGIVQVSADGGTASEITILDAGLGETSHRFPVLLPGGEHLLFVAYGSTYDDVAIIAQSLATGQRRVLIQRASQPVYTSSGHLLYMQPERPGTILAVPFDATTATLTGVPVPAAEDVLTDRGDYAEWSVSQSGLLVYAAGGFKEPERDLVSVDRQGIATPFGTPPRRPYQFPRLSPDGRRIVVGVDGIQSSVWMYERSSGSFNRLTFEGNNFWAIWSPDGKRITYASNRAEPWRLYWKPFDGSGKEEKLLTIGKGDQQPYSWSPDGKLLVYQDSTPASRQDIWALSLEGDRRPRPLVQTPASEVDAALSGDGRWLAYASDESGRYEVYVQPLGGGGKWQVSIDGGREPLWAHSGRELFYRSGEKMMVAAVTSQPTFQASSSRMLFQGSYAPTNTTSANFDVAADDQHFVLVQPSPQPSATELHVVLNWFEELKRVSPLIRDGR